MTTSESADQPPESGAHLAASLSTDVATLDRELTEIDMLVGQARAESARHEQKRAQLAEKLATTDPKASPTDVADAWTQLVTLTRRAVLMEAQVDVLDGKRRALARHREAIAAIVTAIDTLPATIEAVAPEAEAASPSMSRVVMSAQEDLRRDISRAMHDGPAQSLTNIVLQAAIVERLLGRDPEGAKGELRLLVTMVQHTLEATKSFIFDVRPMVLDDLGVVPTLRRMTRDRGRKAKVPVEFESLGQEQRLPMDLESTIFRILDDALGAYLALSPERVQVVLDWTEELDARVVAERSPITAQRRAAARGAQGRARRHPPDDPGPPRRTPRARRGREDGGDRRAAGERLPRRLGPRSVHRRPGRPAGRRRGAARGRAAAQRAHRGRRSDAPVMIDRRGARGDATAGPGIIETSLVLGLAILIALVIIVFFGGALAAAIDVLVDAAHGTS